MLFTLICHYSPKLTAFCKFLIQMEKDPSPADAYLILYSVIDKASFDKAESMLRKLQHSPATRYKTAILVANKVDLARSRAVSSQGESS